MYKQLTEEQQEKIIDAAIHEFADKGYSSSNMSYIAKNSGVSVGVIYKYYADKAALFNACIEKCIALLAEHLGHVGDEGGDIYDMMRNLIRRNISFAKENPDYIRMYHAITTGDTPVDSSTIVMKIEKSTADDYMEAIKEAIEAGQMRTDIEPEAFAFFFDNLMMMLHFSYACNYYEERFKVYGGENAIDRDKWIEEELMKFIKTGFKTN